MNPAPTGDPARLDSLIGELAEEFTQRVRRGEQPDVEEFARRHPHAADAIRQILPALGLLADSAASDGAASRRTSEPFPPLELPSGKLGDYHILREIGRGGMGIVYEAEQQSLGRPVALKVLPRQAMLDAKHKKRFLREAKAAAKLHHTNIVPVFAVGEEAGLCYYAMQFIQGCDLDEVLAELRRLRLAAAASMSGGDPVTLPAANVSAAALTNSLLTGSFWATVSIPADPGSEPETPSDACEALGVSQPPRPAAAETAAAGLSDTRVRSGSELLAALSGETAVSATCGPYWQSVARIGLQAAEALEHAHRQGILHRDVKPSNMLLDAAGTVWLTDFGLAKADDQPNLTRTGDLIGTLRYMAPEAFQGRADALSDVYSLGLTLYELLALRPAFDATDRQQLVRQTMHDVPPRLRSLEPAIPRDLETIVHKAIDRHPAGRYQSAGELAADLERYLNNEPIQARRVSLAARLNRWRQRNPAVAALTLALASLLIVVSVVSTLAAARFRQMADDRQQALGDAVQAKNAAQDEKR